MFKKKQKRNIPALISFLVITAVYLVFAGSVAFISAVGFILMGFGGSVALAVIFAVYSGLYLIYLEKSEMWGNTLKKLRGGEYGF